MTALEKCRPMPPGDYLDERMRGKYTVDAGSGCFIWTGALNQGQAQMKHEGKAVYVHRLNYETRVGTIPEHHELRHRCGVLACVNPAHLVPVARGSAAAATHRAKTQCQKGHPYDEANTYVTKNGKRMCRTCRSPKRLGNFL